MKKLFFVLAFMIPTVSFAKTYCERNPIYCKIKKLQPRINKSFAMKVSNLIHKGAKSNGTDPLLSVAILNQENSFNEKHTWKITREVVKSCTDSACTEVITETHLVKDMTIAQINITTAKAYKLDLERLFAHDLEYAIESHFIILKSKIKQCAYLGDEAWSCYHSATPKFRMRYIEMVSRYY